MPQSSKTTCGNPPGVLQNPSRARKCRKPTWTAMPESGMVVLEKRESWIEAVGESFGCLGGSGGRSRERMFLRRERNGRQLAVSRSRRMEVLRLRRDRVRLFWPRSERRGRKHLYPGRRLLRLHLVDRALPGQYPLTDPHSGWEMMRALRRAWPDALAACVMPNHLHVLVASDSPAQEQARLSKVIGGFTRRAHGQWIWQPVPSPTLVADRSHLQRTIRYVHLNRTKCPFRGCAHGPAR
jgi:hypothetical protein